MGDKFYFGGVLFVVAVCYRCESVFGWVSLRVRPHGEWKRAEILAFVLCDVCVVAFFVKSEKSLVFYVKFK